MSWFGKAVPLISMGKKTEKQPVYVSKFEETLMTLSTYKQCQLSHQFEISSLYETQSLLVYNY